MRQSLLKVKTSASIIYCGGSYSSIYSDEQRQDSEALVVREWRDCDGWRGDEEATLNVESQGGVVDDAREKNYKAFCRNVMQFECEARSEEPCVINNFLSSVVMLK